MVCFKKPVSRAPRLVNVQPSKSIWSVWCKHGFCTMRVWCGRRGQRQRWWRKGWCWALKKLVFANVFLAHAVTSLAPIVGPFSWFAMPLLFFWEVSGVSRVQHAWMLALR